MCKNTMGKCLFHRVGGPTSIGCSPVVPTIDELGHADLEAAMVAFARDLQECGGVRSRAGDRLMTILEESGVDVSPRTEE